MRHSHGFRKAASPSELVEHEEHEIGGEDVLVRGAVEEQQIHEPGQHE